MYWLPRRCTGLDGRADQAQQQNAGWFSPAHEISIFYYDTQVIFRTNIPCFFTQFC
jgi:hypothetical protein